MANIDPTQLIQDIADAIEAGKPVDDTDRLQAAGFSAQDAADNSETDLLDLIVLVGAKKYWAAALKISMMGMSASASTPPPVPSTPFGRLTNPRGNNGAAGSTPTARTRTK